MDPAFVDDNPDVHESWVPLLEAEPLDRNVVFRQALSGARHNVIDRLGELSHPTLVVTGDKDRLISMKNSEVLASRIQNSRLVVLPGAGHELTTQTPERVGPLLHEFLLG
jgi:pimeloyl-ACP methyl ester carboxylesterase